MGYESIAHETEGRMGYWLRGHEAMRLKGYSEAMKKSKLVGQKISRLNIFHKLKLGLNPLLPPKLYKYGGALSY